MPLCNIHNIPSAVIEIHGPRTSMPTISSQVVPISSPSPPCCNPVTAKEPLLVQDQENKENGKENEPDVLELSYSELLMRLNINNNPFRTRFAAMGVPVFREFTRTDISTDDIRKLRISRGVSETDPAAFYVCSQNTYLESPRVTTSAICTSYDGYSFLISTPITCALLERCMGQHFSFVLYKDDDLADNFIECFSAFFGIRTTFLSQRDGYKSARGSHIKVPAYEFLFTCEKYIRSLLINGKAFPRHYTVYSVMVRDSRRKPSDQLATFHIHGY